MIKTLNEKCSQNQKAMRRKIKNPKSKNEKAKTKEEVKKSSESRRTTTFSSLPYDLVLNILARVSTFYRPNLSLVSKSFRSLMASPDLETTRTCMGITENYLCVCLNQGRYSSNSRWFTLAPIPKHEKLVPIPWFPRLHLRYSTVMSVGSEIYIIGGYGHEKYGKRVLVLDIRSPHLRRRALPKMRVSRETPAACVFDGKIYVTGGWVRSSNIEDWGEVYDPKTQTWEPVLPKTLDLPSQMSLPRKFGICCMVKIDNMLCQIQFQDKFLWCDIKESWRWTMVKGLEGLPKFEYIIPFSDGSGRSLTVWWKTVVYRSQCPNRYNVWCAEISFKRRCSGSVWGFVEWSKIVFTCDKCDFNPHNFLLHSVVVSY